MRLVIISIFSSVFFLSDAFGCTCPSAKIGDVKKESIRASELIFIGQVIDIDTVKGIYQIEILEVFKGRIGKMVIASNYIDSVELSTCGYWPSLYWGQEFLFYANRAKGTDRIFVDQCSATRSLTNPQIHPSYFSGKYRAAQRAFYAEMTFEEKINYLREDNNLKQQAFRDLLKELKELRKFAKRHGPS
jgi:hypothetical protein